MRDILFRGMTRKPGERAKTDGTPVPGNWVYGGIFPGDGDFSVIYQKKPVEKFSVYSDTISQYTGICDKNGVKIFEGDIVTKEDKYCKMYGVISFGRHSPTTAELGEVGFYIKWVDDNSNLWSEWIRNDLGFWVDNGVEVIGNIHENKELSEEGNG